MPKWWIKADYKQKISRKWGEKPHFRLIFGRSGRIRTDGIEVPNFARYQLRHTPIGENIQFFCQIRKWSNLWSKVFCRNTRRQKSEKTREKRRFCELSAFGSQGGHTLPNAARYQLRYTPIVIKLWSCKWSNLWSNTFLTAIFCFPNRPKSARLKGFRRFSLSCGANTVYAPKASALPTAPHPETIP